MMTCILPTDIDSSKVMMTSPIRNPQAENNTNCTIFYLFYYFYYLMILSQVLKIEYIFYIKIT